MIFRCFLVVFGVLSVPILSNSLAIDAELNLTPKDANSIATLQRIVLLQDLDLNNLNQVLNYYGFPGLDTKSTEVALNDYQFTVSQALQIVQFSRFLAPKIYSDISLFFGPPLNTVADILEQKNIDNINGLISELDLSIRSILIPFKQIAGLERKNVGAENALSLQSKDIGPDSLLGFIFGSVKDLIKTQVDALISLLIIQVDTRFEQVITQIRSWNLEGFSLDISQSVIGILQLVSSIIKEQLYGIQSYVTNQFAVI